MVARARGGRFQANLMIRVGGIKVTFATCPSSGAAELNLNPPPNVEDICCPTEFLALITSCSLSIKT